MIGGQILRIEDLAPVLLGQGTTARRNLVSTTFLVVDKRHAGEDFGLGWHMDNDPDDMKDNA